VNTDLTPHREPLTVADLQRRLADADGELDAAQQELFENSRTLGVMSKDLHEARRTLEALTAEVTELRATTKQQRSRIASLEKRHTAMRRSTSWRITIPLRLLARILQRLRKAVRG
jgi:hypothetical protein